MLVRHGAMDMRPKSQFALIWVSSAVVLLLTCSSAAQSPPPPPAPAGPPVATVLSTLTAIPAGSCLLAGKMSISRSEFYMAQMRLFGVRRAMVVVEGTMRGGALAESRIARVLYFQKYDGPNALIENRGKLATLAGSGLARALRVAALSRAGAMTEQFKSDSAVAVPGPTEEHGYVVFNADEWMPVCDFESRLRPGLAKPETLDEAAEEQDLPAIAAILSAQVPSQSAL